MAWNNWALGMRHGMEWNETNRKTHTTSSLCAQSKHSAVAAAAAAIAHRQRTQQQAGSGTLWKLSERAAGMVAKSSWVSHTSTACLMRNKMVTERFCEYTHIHKSIRTYCTCTCSYMHTHRFANVWNVLYIGQKQLRCQRWDWPLTTSYKRAHTERHATWQSYKSTRSSHILHTYICMHIVNIPNTCIHITFVCTCTCIHIYVSTYINCKREHCTHCGRKSSLSLWVCVCVCVSQYPRERGRHGGSGSKRVVAGSIKKEAWTNSWTLLINNNNALLSHSPCSLMRLCICMSVHFSVCMYTYSCISARLKNTCK